MGHPQLVTSVDYDDNDEKMLKDFFPRALKYLKWQDVRTLCKTTANRHRVLNTQMGGVRMGRS